MEETVSAQALRDSEELHRITLINMSDAVFITDDAGDFTRPLGRGIDNSQLAGTH